jgi:hypothetical protein
MRRPLSKHDEAIDGRTRLRWHRPLDTARWRWH